MPPMAVADVMSAAVVVTARMRILVWSGVLELFR